MVTLMLSLIKLLTQYNMEEIQPTPTPTPTPLPIINYNDL